MLMTLGVFAFSLETVAYTELQRREAWRHGKTSRVGARPASQFLGPGEDTITLPGLLAPGQTGDVGSLAELRAMAAAGDAYDLVSGRGEVLGAFTIESIDTKAEFFLPDGSARRIEFTMSLNRVDDADSASDDAG